MKRAIVLLAATVAVFACVANDDGRVSAQEVRARNGIGNVLSKLKAGKPVKIAYFGGSITAMDGWRRLSREWLKSQYPNCDIGEIHAAIGGTGSGLGVFRYGQDVLDKNPDLVFVEFATNDSSTPQKAIWRNFDGIVRQTWKRNPSTDIVFVYTITAPMMPDYGSGFCNNAASAMERLADHYGIPSICFGPRVAAEVKAGRLVMSMKELATAVPKETPDRDALIDAELKKSGKTLFARDGVHPALPGHGFYLESIKAAWAQFEAIKPSAAAERQMKPFYDSSLEDAKMVAITPSMLSGTWKAVEGKELNGNFAERFGGKPWMTKTPGSKLSFKFSGTCCRIYDLLGPACGQLWVTVDGKRRSAPVVRFDSFCTYYRLADFHVYSGEKGVHTVEIELDSKQPSRQPVAFRLKDPEKELASPKYNGTEWFPGRIMLVGDIVEEPFRVDVKRGESLVAVRDKVRALPEDVRRRGVEVVLEAGEYFLPEGLALSAADGGLSEAHPVTWRAGEPGAAKIVGARRIRPSAFSQVKDPALLARLPKEARGKVFSVNLSALFPNGAPPFSTRPGGGPNGFQPAPPTVFVDGRHGVLAQWPNGDNWCEFSQKVDTGTHVEGSTFKGGAFVFSDPRLKRWDFSKGVWLSGYFTHDWASWAVPAVSWGTENGTNDVVRISPDAKVPYGVMGRASWGRKERRFRAFNLFEELDETGEWWLDRDDKTLYVIPSGERVSEGTDIRIAVSDRTLLHVKNARNLRFEGIEFAYCYGILACVDRCEGVELLDCRFLNTASRGIVVDGLRCRVSGCEVANCGLAGVSVTGGNRKNLTPSGNVVENCRIHGFGVFQRTYAPGINVSYASVGAVVRGNEIFDAPHSAVLFGGNDNLFESNDVHHVLLETGDAGAFYTGRDWTTQGNVLRYNYVHDIGRGTSFGSGNGDVSVSGVNTMGFYFDDCDCGDEVYGNTFHNVARGIMVGGGRDHPIVSNTFSRCNIALSIDCRGMTWKQWNVPGGGWNLEEKAKSLDYTNGVWAARYPRLANIMNDHPREPLYNPVVGNTFIDCREALVLDKCAPLERMAPIRDNVVVNTGAGKTKIDPRIAGGFKTVVR